MFCNSGEIGGEIGGESGEFWRFINPEFQTPRVVCGKGDQEEMEKKEIYSL